MSGGARKGRLRERARGAYALKNAPLPGVLRENLHVASKDEGRGKARVPRAVVVDALGDAQRGVRRGHRVERDTTRVGLTNPGRVGKPVVRISLV